MNYVKSLSFTMVVAVAVMAFATASASATALYNGTTKLGSGNKLDFSLGGLNRAVLVNTKGEELDSCSTSTIKGKLSSDVTGSIESMSWESCTFPTKTVTLGKLEVVWTKGTEGTVKTDAEISVTINTVFFGSCVYGNESGVTLGTLTTFSSGVAQFDANAVVERLSPSSFACPETAKWTGLYYNTEPTNLQVESS